MFRSIGPVGRQRGLAGDRRRRDLRRVPGVVRDDVLGLLHRAAADPRAADRARGLVRVARARDGAALARPPGCGRTDRQRRRAVHLGRGAGQTSCTACRWTRRRVFTGNVLDLFSAYTVRAGLAVVALRAPRRDVPDAADGGRLLRAGGRGPRGCRRPGGARRRRDRRVDGRRRPRSQQPRHPPDRGPRGADRARAAARPRAHARATASGWAFAATGLAALVLRRDDLHRRSIRACSSRTRTSRTASRSPTPRPGTTRSGDHRRRRDLQPVVLLYQGWTYHVFRDRLGAPSARRAEAACAALDPRLVRRTRPVRPLLALDTALGVATVVPVMLQAVLLGADRGRGGRRRLARGAAAPTSSCSRCAFAAARRARLGHGGRGPPRGGGRAVRAAAGARRAPPGAHPIAADGTEAGEIAAAAVKGVDALDGYFARYLPQLVLAAIVPLAVVALGGDDRRRSRRC